MNLWPSGHTADSPIQIYRDGRRLGHGARPSQSFLRCANGKFAWFFNRKITKPQASDRATSPKPWYRPPHILGQPQAPLVYWKSFILFDYFARRRVAQWGPAQCRHWLMSDFARGVVGVFVIGMVAGAGALMLTPKSSPPAAQTASAPEQACAKNDPACHKTTAQQRDGGKKDTAADRVLSSANTVASNGRTAAGLVTVDAQAIAALRRGESLQPEPVTEAAPETPAAAPDPAVTPAPAAAPSQPAAAPAVTGAPSRRVAYTAARRAPPARRTARQTAAYHAYGSARNRGFAMGFPFFQMFR
jgi:hypothetical protein